MPAAADQLKTQLAELPLADRAELARYLIDSLDEGHNAEVDAAWEAELTLRLQQIRSASAQTETAEAVFQKLREKYP